MSGNCHTPRFERVEIEEFHSETDLLLCYHEVEFSLEFEHLSHDGSLYCFGFLDPLFLVCLETCFTAPKLGELGSHRKIIFNAKLLLFWVLLHYLVYLFYL